MQRQLQSVLKRNSVPPIQQCTSQVSNSTGSLPGLTAQLESWEPHSAEKGANQRWDVIMDGVWWYSDGVKMWYRIDPTASPSEDYTDLEGEHKTYEEWHSLRQITHPKEYEMVEDEVFGVDEVRPDYAGDLMVRYKLRYETDINWKGGEDDEVQNIVVIDTKVKKKLGGTEPVYQNSYDIGADLFSADWNQRKLDQEVGVDDPPALYNNDLLTCHREMAREFAISKGVEVHDDSEGFEIARHNINNKDWQDVIFPSFPIRIRGKLGQGIRVTEAAPMPIGKEIELNGKKATSMWEVFEKLIPNTKAVFRIVGGNYPGFKIAAWRFESSTAIAEVVPA